MRCSPMPPETPVVVKSDMVSAFRRLGVSAGDSMLIHSSLKSFGQVSGGAVCVIDAAKETLTQSGTLIFPTLVQRDFQNAYKNWDIENSPSDVGLLSETFRRLPDSLRSDQATHSVAAWGARAREITCAHSSYGPRMGIFGDYCFSWSSPWQRMYFLGTRIVFIGVTMVYNTFKHFAEYMLVEESLGRIANPRLKCEAMAQIRTFSSPGVWPLHDGMKTQEVLDAAGLLSRTRCGSSDLISVQADAYVDHMLGLFRSSPEEWFDSAFSDWFKRYGGC